MNLSTDDSMCVSVVIPMYNSKETIVAAIDSVLNQIYCGKWELIIVNDGSTDGSQTVVEEYLNALKATNIKLVNKKNGGVSSARNIGIKMSKGEWVAFLDSDDVWLPDKLEKQFNFIREQKGIRFVGGNVNQDRYPLLLGGGGKSFTINAYNLILKWYPSTPTVLVKKELLIQLAGFDETKRYGEDCDMWLRCLMQDKLHIINETLALIGSGKRPYGERGLSADVVKMYFGEIANIHGAFLRGQIIFLFFILSIVWISIKFLRRLLITFINFKIK